MLNRNLDSIKFDKAYRIIAMKRSGHHAVIEWIISNLDSNVFFCNNISKESGYKIFDKKKSNNVLIYNIEDYSSKSKNLLIRPDLSKQDILVYRDPLNLFSSRIKVSKKHKYENWFNDYSLDLFNFHLKLRNEMYSINYSDWVIDEDYRNKISENLQINKTRPQSNPSIYGGGSSFSGLSRELSKESLMKRYLSLTNKERKLIESKIDLTEFKKYYNE